MKNHEDFAATSSMCRECRAEYDMERKGGVNKELIMSMRNTILELGELVEELTKRVEELEGKTLTGIIPVMEINSNVLGEEEKQVHVMESKIDELSKESDEKEVPKKVSKKAKKVETPEESEEESDGKEVPKKVSKRAKKVETSEESEEESDAKEVPKKASRKAKKVETPEESEEESEPEKKQQKKEKKEKKVKSGSSVDKKKKSHK